MAALVRRIGPLERGARRRGRPDDAYGVLVRTIVGQQLSTKAARSIYNRLAAIFGDRPPTPEELLAADEDELRAAGLSRPKIRYLRDLASHVLTGEVDFDSMHALSGEDVGREISKVADLGPRETGGAEFILVGGE